MKHPMLHILLILLITACAKAPSSDSSGLQTIIPKALASTWRSPSPNWTMNLSDLINPSPKVTVSYGTGGRCSGDIVQTWFQDSDYGTFTLSNESADILLPGDPPCSQFNGSWTYSLLGSNRLILCEVSSGNCVAFN